MLNINIAKIAYWMLKNPVQYDYSQEFISSRYLYYLKQNNLLTTVGGRVNQASLKSMINNLYGEEFLKIMNSQIAGNKGDWLHRFFSIPMHPIRHILIMNCLDINPEDFFDTKEKDIRIKWSDEEPFGKGPWPCLNRATSHYRENVITQCEVSLSTHKRNVPVGRFICKCGFVYTRFGPDKCESDRYKISMVAKRGNVFWEKVRFLKEQNMSLHEIARQLDINYSALCEKNKILESSNNPDIRTVIQDGKRDERRERYIKILQDNPNKSRVQIRELFGRPSWEWMAKNDREWLNENAPSVKRQINRSEIIDWDKLDDEYYEKVARAIKELSLGDKLVRITYLSIIRHLGEIYRPYRFKKMHKTAALINEAIESHEDFQKRKLMNAARIMIGNGQRLTYNKLIKEIGIYARPSKEVIDFIENMISEYNEKRD
jgi:hypothetical protein